MSPGGRGRLGMRLIGRGTNSPREGTYSQLHPLLISSLLSCPIALLLSCNTNRTVVCEITSPSALHNASITCSPTSGQFLSLRAFAPAPVAFSAAITANSPSSFPLPPYPHCAAFPQDCCM